jgi:hypothetical protein
MGYMRHHAIIMTSWKKEVIEAAAVEARRLGCETAGPVESMTNSFWSLLIAPDGSKEGWDESDAGDERRAALVRWTKTLRYEDGSSPLEWAEVVYSNDDNDAELVQHEWSELIRDEDEATAHA